MPWDFGMNKVDQIEMILSEFYFKTSKQVSFVNKAINIDYSLSHLHAFLTNLNTIYHILYIIYYCVLYIIHTPMRLYIFVYYIHYILYYILYILLCIVYCILYIHLCVYLREWVGFFSEGFFCLKCGSLYLGDKVGYERALKANLYNFKRY